MNNLLTTIKQFLATDTARLMFTYVSIIMLMSVSFSIVLYITSARQLEYQRPVNTIFQTPNGIIVAPTSFQSFINTRIDESHKIMIERLVVLNLATLVLALFASHYLARKNLEPIEASMRAQTQFISDASHELRTPLTSLMLTNEVALRKKKLSLKDAKNVIKETIDEAAKLQRLTDGLLTLVRGDTILQKTSPINLQDIIGAAIAQIEPKAAVKHITIESLTQPLIVTLQPDMIERVLVILLDNAVKYSNNKSRITIKSNQTQKHTIITVKDSGHGISADDIDHIFTRFYRADKARTGTNGYGLGLAIAKQIVLNHNGSITVHSTLGKGSSFIIKLPNK